jgi:hypothetical protein
MSYTSISIRAMSLLMSTLAANLGKPFIYLILRVLGNLRLGVEACPGGHAG